MAPTLRKVEKEVLIPRYLEYKINHELCKEEARIFAVCAKEAGLSVVLDCKEQLMKFSDCSNYYFRDEETRKKVEQEYVDKRTKFRLTGEREKSPFGRL